MAAKGTTVMKNGVKVTTAVTADQVILSHIVSPGKKFLLSYAEANVRLTTFATTATNFGTVSILAGTTRLFKFSVVAGPGVLNSPIYVDPPEALAIVGNSDGTTTVSIVCTPAATTSFTWDGNLGGYEV